MASLRHPRTICRTIATAAIEAGLPTLLKALQTIDRSHEMIRRKIRDDLTPWLQAARSSLIVSFANGVAKDEAAVRAAITTSWSNAQTEGQVTRLKPVERQMYGRAKIDLLQARLVGATRNQPFCHHQKCDRAIVASLNTTCAGSLRSLTGSTTASTNKLDGTVSGGSRASCRHTKNWDGVKPC